jgi:hypothetical protein
MTLLILAHTFLVLVRSLDLQQTYIRRDFISRSQPSQQQRAHFLKSAEIGNIIQPVMQKLV